MLGSLAYHAEKSVLMVTGGVYCVVLLGASSHCTQVSIEQKYTYILSIVKGTYMCKQLHFTCKFADMATRKIHVFLKATVFIHVCICALYAFTSPDTFYTPISIAGAAKLA